MDFNSDQRKVMYCGPSLFTRCTQNTRVTLGRGLESPLLHCEMLDMPELRFSEVNGFEFRHKGVEARPWLNQSLVVNHLVMSPSFFLLLP